MSKNILEVLIENYGFQKDDKEIYNDEWFSYIEEYGDEDGINWCLMFEHKQLDLKLDPYELRDYLDKNKEEEKENG